MTTIAEILREAYTHWNDADVLHRQGRELQARNRQDDAGRVLTRAVVLQPKNADAWTELSYACFRSLRETDGIDALRKGIEATGSELLKSALSA